VSKVVDWLVTQEIIKQDDLIGSKNFSSLPQFLETESAQIFIDLIQMFNKCPTKIIEDKP